MTSSSSNDCVGVLDALGALLSGDFTPDEFKRANRHLASCPTCREQYAKLASFRGEFRDVYDVMESQPSVAARSDNSSRPADRRRVWGGIGLAASLVIGLAVYRSAPDRDAMMAAPEIAAVLEVATSPEATTAPYVTASNVDNSSRPAVATPTVAQEPQALTDEDMALLDEMTDEELDDMVTGLGA